MHAVKTTNWWAVAVSTAQFCPQKPSRNTAADARAGEGALQPDWTPPWPAAHQVSSIMTYSQGQTYLALQIYIQCRRTACSVHVARHGADSTCTFQRSTKPGSPIRFPQSPKCTIKLHTVLSANKMSTTVLSVKETKTIRLRFVTASSNTRGRGKLVNPESSSS